jgi:hypothetical protein
MRRVVSFTFDSACFTNKFVKLTRGRKLRFKIVPSLSVKKRNVSKINIVGGYNGNSNPAP